MWNPSDDTDAVARAHDSASDTEHASAENDAVAPLQAQRGYSRPAGRTDPHSGDRHGKSRELRDPSHRDGYTAPHRFSSQRTKIKPCLGGHCRTLAHATALGVRPSEDSEHFAEVMRAAKAIHETFAPSKLNYSCYGNAEPHVHWHIVPRYTDDPNLDGDPGGPSGHGGKPLP